MLGRLSRLFASIDHRTLRELNRLEQYQKVLDLYERTQFTDSTERELSRRQYAHALTQKTAHDLVREPTAPGTTDEKPVEKQGESRPLFTENVGPELGTKKTPEWTQWQDKALMACSVAAFGVGILLAFHYNTNSNFLYDAKKHIVLAESSKVTFNDVKGVDECREEVSHIVDFLRSPDKFHKIGARLPKGVLLTGEPGTGKTLLARAIAGEAGVKFFFSSGSDFEEMFVGLGAKRVRELFAEAKKQAPAIIFIDELDALGTSRDSAAAYNRQSLNQLLVEMDGFQETDNVIVIAATNFPQMLDSALKRSGRFDKEIHIPLPSLPGRVDILKLYLSKVFYDESISPEALARLTPGMSGADLANLVNIAMLNAIKQGRSSCNSQDVDFAIDRVRMGVERKSLVMTIADRRATAIHETGHLLCGLLTDRKKRLRKVTILPRGATLGMTQFEDIQDRLNEFRIEVLADLDVALGGRVAEELFLGFDNVSAGCESDLQDATSSLYFLVRGGMFEEFTGIVNTQELGEKVGTTYRVKVDRAVKAILNDAYQRAKAKLTKHRDLLGKLSEELMERETLTLAQVSEFIRQYSAREGKSLEDFRGLE